MNPRRQIWAQLRRLAGLAALAGAATCGLPQARAQTAPSATLPGVAGYGTPAKPTRARFDMLADVSACAPGQPFWAAVRVKLDAGWHIYWINYGDAGEGTNITWQLPPGWSAGPVQWPTPKRLLDAGIMDYIYDDTALFLTQITPPASLASGATVTLKAKVHWMACADVCLLPTDTVVSLDLPVAATAEPDKTSQPLFDQARAALPRAPDLFNVTAWRQGDKLFIGLQPKPDSGLSIQGDFKDAYFFSADSQTQPAAPQVLHHTAAGWVLEMTRIASAPPDAKTLPGILTLNGFAGSVTMNGASASADPFSSLNLNPTLLGSVPAAFADLAGNTGAPIAAGSLLGILVLCFFGGLILNIMPCVFPVLAIKVLGFVKQAGAERRRVVMHGLTFAGGVLVSLWALVGLLLALRAGGAQLGWGFQLQQPAFVLGLAIFFLLFAMSLSGVFEIGGSLIGLGSELTAKQGLSGSFFQGVLAVVVATPCTAPLLAPALGAAFTLPPLPAFLAFTCIALGLATPYLLLSIFPGLARKLPRPGAWMETFKQLMAFPLYATVGFLLYTLNGQISPNKFLDVMLAMVLIAMAAWLYGREATPAASVRHRRFAQIGALLLFAAGTAWAYWPVHELNWEPWSAARVAELQKEGRPVYVDFTARWCVNCQVNEAVVFNSAQVLDTVAARHVALLRADLTKPDAAITAELAKFGRAGVPFNLVYVPGRSDPIVLPTALTPGIVLDALNSGSAPAAAH